MKIAIISARGGSKRIPRKNIKLFAGKPMIFHPVQAALKSGLFDRVIVSTDDDEIAGVAKESGAEVPFRRPAELSDDHTPMRPVLRHAIEELEREHATSLSAVCSIYATAAFLTPEDIHNGYDMIKKGAMFAFAACAYPHPIQRAFSLGDIGQVTPANPASSKVRTQDLVEYYHDTGMFCWGTRDGFFSDVPMFSGHSRIVPISKDRAIDIDDIDDWRRAEIAYPIVNEK